MRFRLIASSVLAVILASCGGDKDRVPLMGTLENNTQRASALYSEAQTAEKNGNRGKAIKLYDKLADEMPTTRPYAADARFRQGELLEQDGDIQKSFAAYQDFIVRYNDSNKYETALSRQAAMAQSAADGHVKTSFLGLKASISDEKITDMLAKVRQNAPRSPTASKAQFTIGQVWESRGSAAAAAKATAAYRELVVEYPDSKEAPEGQFRIGKILVDQAKQGNQDQANLDRAKQALQDYIRQYPNHSRVGEAKQMIANIGGQDIERSYDIAQFYERKGDIASAKFYYEEVVRQGKSGGTYDKAKARLAALGGH